MGRRGPAPAPTALKLLRGERRPSRINAREPKPLPGLPGRPADLGPGATSAWDRVLAELGPSGVLTGVDRDVLRAYVEAVERYEQAAIAYARSGPLIRGARQGELIKNPLHQIVRDNAMLVLALARELGATPSARSGLRAPAAEPGAKLAAFLAGTRHA
jgi:P27 family predicted phage terminase small subunit